MQEIADCEALLVATPESAETHGLLALLFYQEGQSSCAHKHMELALHYDSSQ
jgi:tetratricopeptide (TPR) repeat protein